MCFCCRQAVFSTRAKLMNPDHCCRLPFGTATSNFCFDSFQCSLKKYENWLVTDTFPPLRTPPPSKKTKKKKKNPPQKTNKQKNHTKKTQTKHTHKHTYTQNPTTPLPLPPTNKLPISVFKIHSQLHSCSSSQQASMVWGKTWLGTFSIFTEYQTISANTFEHRKTPLF